MPFFLLKLQIFLLLSLGVVFFSFPAVLGQAPARPIRAKTVNDTLDLGVRSNAQIPEGLMYISQKVDLSQQLSTDEVVFSLDGEPVPHLQATSVTLGVLIDKEGYIITRLANIPATDAKGQIRVYPGNKQQGQYDARFIGVDSVTGICVIKVDQPGFAEAVKISALAKNDVLPLQRQVQVRGIHPQQNVGMAGVVVIKPRIFPSTAVIKKAQDDFRYSSGNPLYHIVTPLPLTPVQDCSLVLEKDGSVFGLVAYDTSGENAHVVYPLTRLQKLASLIIKNSVQAKRNVVPHAWLGATGNGITRIQNELAPESKGIQIASVFPDSPAELAGIRPSDILLSIGGRSLTTGRDLRDTLQMLPADSEVTLKIKRNKEYKTFQAKLVPAPALDAKQQANWIVSQVEEYEQNVQKLSPNDPRRDEIEKKKNTMVSIMNQIFNASPPEIHLNVRYGLEILPLTAQLSKYFSAPGGVLISKINSFGKSAQAGLKIGDVLVKVGEQPVVDVASLFQAFNTEKNDPMELLIVREGKTLKLANNSSPKIIRTTKKAGIAPALFIS